jgi:F0F1-type ATP synthase membrane subunit c/vacuolar-type H+-ATPase subunit K
MTVTALILLGVAALTPLVPVPRRLAWWIVPALTALALGGSALAAAATDPVTGFALGATVVLTVLAASTGGAPMVHVAFRIARRRDASGPNPDAGPLRGGRTIGVLERAAVSATILAGWPEGLAVVLAVKGLARYPELREPHASEQFIIGTFTSVLWAAAAAGVGHALVT